MTDTDAATLEAENEILRTSLSTALTALEHYRRSGAWSHIAADAIEDIHKYLREIELV